MCARVSEGEGERIIGFSPEQHMAGVAGGDPFKGVHLKLVEVASGVLRMNVGSKFNTKTNNTFGENEKRK